MEQPRPERVDKRALWLAGVVATILALSALWAISSLVRGVPFPPAAFAQLIVRDTPGGVATALIELLHHWALRLLTLVVLLGTVALGAQSLVVTADDGNARPFFSGALLGVVALIAILVAPHGGVSLVPTVLSLVAAALVYAVAGGRIAALGAAREGTGPDPSRRRALGMGLATALGLALGGGALGWLARRLSGPDTNVALGRASVPAKIPMRSPWPDIPGLSREVTSPARHYVVDIDLVQPFVEEAGWSLSVGGEVDNPLTLSFSELQTRFEFVEEYAVLTCVSNEVGGDLIGNSLWGGVRLVDVLGAAGLRPGVVDLAFSAADGYSDSIPVAVARDPSVLLAVAQNRRPLTQDHGFPCRLRVPPIYGMKNVKWIRSIEAVRSDYRGYWQRRGWSDVATVRTESRIDVAGSDGSASAGQPSWIAGVAWAGDRGVSRVEVSTDGGRTWTDAELRAPVGSLAWRQWALRWTPAEAGDVEVMCRATDGRGDVQTASLAPPHPSGATGYHTVGVHVS